MTRSRLLTSLVALALFLSAGMTALVGSARAQDAGNRPVLRFGVNAADLATLDPHFASGTQDRTVVDMVFNGLVRFAPGNSAEIEPDIAVAIPEPEIVDGKQVWTFELRDDVMCHPGPDTEAYPLTADDVVYSLKRMLTKKLQLEGFTTLSMVNAAGIKHAVKANARGRSRLSRSGAIGAFVA